VSSICPICSLPTELCVCSELEREATKIRVRLEVRKFNKPTTIIEGISLKKGSTNDIVKKLKSELACGGTVKSGMIILQGDHRSQVKGILTKIGFDYSSIEVE